jgi:outer membrane protein insertion porin family
VTVRLNGAVTGCLYSRLFWLLAALLIGSANAYAQPAGPTISAVEIQGNQRVEPDAIRLHITSQPGEPLNLTTVDDDIKSIYRMGFFNRVNADVEHHGGTVTLIYQVQERPEITDVRFGGMKAIKATDDSIINAVKLHGGTVLDPARVQETIRGIEEAYQDKGYLDAKVTFRTVPEGNNTAIGVFDVNEGPVVENAAVNFVGNNHFTSRTLGNLLQTHQHNI